MAFSTLEALQAFGLGQQQATQKRELERRERDLDRREQTRTQVSSRVGAGDYRGGMQAAIGGGEYDLAGSLGKLDEQQRGEVLQQAQIMGRLAQQLKSVPPDQRASAYQQLLPTLQAAGMDPDQLAQADLSDAGLDGYARMGQSVMQVLSPPQVQDEYTLAPGAVRYRGGEVVARSPYDPVVQADGQIFVRRPNGPSPAPSAAGMSPQALQAQADQAIAAGADPAAVNARLQQMLGGAGPSDPQTFP